mgnify:CR=1 FL=1
MSFKVNLSPKNLLITVLLCSTLPSNANYHNEYNYSMGVVKLDNDLYKKNFCVSGIIWTEIYRTKDTRENRAVLSFQPRQAKARNSSTILLNCKKIDKNEWETKYKKYD